MTNGDKKALAGGGARDNSDKEAMAGAGAPTYGDEMGGVGTPSNSDKEEMAFRYVRGLLDETEKLRVFELILQDDEFKRSLKAELLLLQRFKAARTPLSPAKKAQLLLAVKSAAQRSQPQPASAWTGYMLKQFVPSPVWPIAQYLLRRGLQ